MSNNNCIIFRNNTFLLNTRNTSYMFKVNEHDHLEHVHYGRTVLIDDCQALSDRRTACYGDSILYSQDDPLYCLNRIPQQYGTQGRGDYREPAVILVDSEGNSSLDLTYRSHEINFDNADYPTDLPVSRKADGLLTVRLCDFFRQVEVQLFYKVFFEEDVIVRSARIINHSDRTQFIRKLMSCALDLRQPDLVEMSFHGEWASEMHLHEQPVTSSTITNSSRVGFSSAACNPGYLLRQSGTDEDSGKVWGFNLIYSGNHYNSTAFNHVGQCRTMIGIQPEGLNWALKPEEAFSAPEAVLSFSDQGLNGLSRHFHDFINRHIVPDFWQYRCRPVLVNSWEGFGFDFNEERLLKLAEEAGKLGCELFVLDDGWFRERNNDLAGLGNYETDLAKLPNGLSSLAEGIRKKGLDFGIWVEPESVSEESELYRQHPEWAVHDGIHKDIYGRNQLLLDLTRKDVQDFIVENVGKVIEETQAAYIKWDMNRQLAGVDQNYTHRYIIGLYSVLNRIFSKRPQLLLESCSSGGNRFDLGMACFSPQIWTSDDTDPLERMRIQKNASYLYPLSMMGAHVAAEVSAQSLRRTSLPLRFNVAAFGILGYEFDLGRLNEQEKQEIRSQIAFYKEHRQTFQYGSFCRLDTDSQHEQFCVTGKDETLAAIYRRLLTVAPKPERLTIRNLTQGTYNITAVEQTYLAEHFNHLLDQSKETQTSGLYRNPAESCQASSLALAEGISLTNVYMAAGYNPDVRIPLDYGSEMYLITQRKEEE